MAADSVFLDTSLLVAASVVEHPSHGLANAYLDELDAKGTPISISPQVRREFHVSLTRQPVSGRPFTVEEALVALDLWNAVCVTLQVDTLVADECERLVRRYQVRGKEVHDCNIVATMRSHGVRRLGTRNPADFERYKTEINIEPVL
jgi:predicted nucleic acid-binding protein